MQQTSFDHDSSKSPTNIQNESSKNNDDSNSRFLHRAFSTVSANQTLVNNQRNLLAKTYRRTSINDDIVTIDHDDADALFILPNLFELSDPIRKYVMDNLIDFPTMNILEETKRLNWWTNQKFSCPKLYPLLTVGDGNCLLHATSLAMWGFHDHALSMRKALNETLITSKANNSLYRRWRWTQSVQNKKYNLVLSEQEWNEEWKNFLRLSSIEPRISQTKLSSTDSSNDESNHLKINQNSAGGSLKSTSSLTRQYYESLEEFHVYALANNIRRPIIVYSDTILRIDGEAISPVEFGGIYLPLEIPPERCHKQPVFLSFDSAHFSALVPMESECTYQIPLIDFETLELLPIHFFVDPGVNFQWPIESELSNEMIDLYSNSKEARMEYLEKYLHISKHYSSINELVLPSNQSTVVKDKSNEIPSVLSQKKSRSSINSFSKILRRTLINPLSTSKRFSLKHHQSVPHRKTSPQLTHSTNLLTVILVEFQPKRPETSDFMIKNYIETCIQQYKPKTIDSNSSIKQSPKKAK